MTKKRQIQEYQTYRFRQREATPASNVFKVERLLRFRRRQHRIEFLVQWSGYSKSESTWEPRQNLLEDCPSLVYEFELREVEKKQSR